MKEENNNQMTLREAYEVWAQENVRLSAKYRQANKEVLLDKYGDIQVTDLTEESIKKIFTDYKGTSENRARASSTITSILYMLEKAKIVKHINLSSETFRIDNDSREDREAVCAVIRDDIEAQIESSRKLENKLANIQEQVDASIERQAEEKIRRPGLPANARPILKLDPKTLEVVKEYDCISDACKDMKLTNLSTYIKHHYKAAGFYWAYPEHLDITRDEIRNKEQAREVVRNPKKPLGGIVTSEARKPRSAYNKPEPVKPLKGKEARDALLKTIDEFENKFFPTGPQIKINVGEQTDYPNVVVIPEDLYLRLQKLGIIPNDVRDRNVGASDYSEHLIQPWAIWQEYDLNPWDADIIKRVLRHKSTDTRKMDYEKIIHICQERIRQLETDIKSNII